MIRQQHEKIFFLSLLVFCFPLVLSQFNGYGWYFLPAQQYISSSHAAVAYKDGMLVYGSAIYYSRVLLFNYTTLVWETLWNSMNSGSTEYPVTELDIAAVLINDTSFALYGSRDLNLWIFNIDTLRWSKIDYDRDSNYTACCGYAITYYNNSVFVFGGYNVITSYKKEYEYSSDMIRIDLVTKQWTKLSSPGVYGSFSSKSYKARSGMGFAKTSDDRLILFGGYRYNSEYWEDVWAYNLKNDSWEILWDGSKPWDRVNDKWIRCDHGVSGGASAIYDAERNGIIVYGGEYNYRIGAVSFTAYRNKVTLFLLDKRVWKVLYNEKTNWSKGTSAQSAVSIGSVMVLYGGQSIDLDILRNLRIFDYKGIYSQYNNCTLPDTMIIVKTISILFGIPWIPIVLCGFVITIMLLRKHRWQNSTTGQLKKNQKPLDHIVDNSFLPGDDFVVFLSPSKTNSIKKGPSINYFTYIPLETVFYVCSFLDDPSLRILSRTCRVFNTIVSEIKHYQEGFLHYWEDQFNKKYRLLTIRPEKREVKSFFPRRQLARKLIVKEQFKRSALHNLGFLLVYFSIFLLGLSITVFFATLKLDSIIHWPWYKIFIPIWILLSVLILITLRVMVWIARNFRIYNVWKGLYLSCLLFFSFLVCLIIFPILLSLKLDAKIHITWWSVFAPILWVIVTLLVWIAIFIPEKVSIRGKILFTIFCVLPLVILWEASVSMLLSYYTNGYPNNFCSIMAPWWAADVIVIILMTFYCGSWSCWYPITFSDACSKRMKLFVLVLFYFICFLIFRSLLCASWNSVRHNYAYSLVVVPVYLFFCLFGGIAMSWAFRFRRTSAVERGLNRGHLFYDSIN
eukprot:TRINITY_DN5440_c0_g4_i1.p1 TRINITY_DN5440_c0_g4~~TRINITY_DN5440_c0_g4_i1.p1  ORF type:complete len:847 (+),score=61.82 TRINITY_DN5440_c0_g4_i1:36-2576(+)